MKKKDNKHIKLNKKNLESMLSNSADIKSRDIIINNKNKDMKVTLYYIDGIVNISDISDYIVKPIVTRKIFKESNNLKDVLKLVEKGEIYNAGQYITTDINKVISEILNGCSVILFNEMNSAAIFDTKKFDKRNIMEPTVENTTKGSKDSFIENYRSNTSTVRRKVKSPDLVIEEFTEGKQSNTNMGLIYMKNIVNDNLLSEVKARLSKINVDNVLTTNVIEEYLADDIRCSFPQVLSTERPDKFCADILEGRVGIIIDGIPFGFIVPCTFIQLIQTSEDYSRSPIIASIIRIIRFFCLIISLIMPSFYIAITMYHPEMMPTNLALFIAKSREGVTFPTAVETILMLGAFEILFEAGLRVPKTVGQAVSIVGTLVVGQASVEANLVSPAVVVIIAITTISAFAMPNQDFSNTIRLWRFFFAILSSFLGLVGIIIGTIVIVYRLCKLESFGVPYLSPFVSNDLEMSFQDTIFRLPIKLNKYRPKELNVKNDKRVGD